MSFPLTPTRWEDEKDHRRRIADVANSVRQGKINSVGDVTVRTSEVTTVVPNFYVSPDSIILLTPLDATAALEYGLGTTYILEANIGGQTFTITHPTNGNTRKYRYVVLG